MQLQRKQPNGTPTATQPEPTATAPQGTGEPAKTEAQKKEKQKPLTDPEVQDILAKLEARGAPFALQATYGKGRRDALQKLKKQLDNGDWLQEDGVWKKKEIVVKGDTPRAGDQTWVAAKASSQF